MTTALVRHPAQTVALALVVSARNDRLEKMLGSIKHKLETCARNLHMGNVPAARAALDEADLVLVRAESLGKDAATVATFRKGFNKVRKLLWMEETRQKNAAHATQARVQARRPRTLPAASRGALVPQAAPESVVVIVED